MILSMINVIFSVFCFYSIKLYFCNSNVGGGAILARRKKATATP